MNEKENPYTVTCFWILAAALLLLGAAVYFLIPGYSFTGLVLAGFGLLTVCYRLIHLLAAHALTAAKFLHLALTAGVFLVLTFVLNLF